jgi:hypothetical protein
MERAALVRLKEMALTGSESLDPLSVAFGSTRAVERRNRTVAYGIRFARVFEPTPRISNWEFDIPVLTYKVFGVGRPPS